MMADVVFGMKADHFAEAEQIIAESIQQLLPSICEALIPQLEAAVPVDTGALQAGFYYVTGDGVANGYDGAAGAVQAMNPRAELAEPAELPPDTTHAYISNAAGHALFVEMGTSKMAAQPFLFPTVDAYRNDFIDAFGRSMQAALDAALGR